MCLYECYGENDEEFEIEGDDCFEGVGFRMRECCEFVMKLVWLFWLDEVLSEVG